MARVRRLPRARRLAGLVVVALVPVVALSRPAAPATAADEAPWPMYGHDRAHTGASPAFAPSSEPPLSWSFPLGAEVFENGSPVVGADGTIYVPTLGSFHAIEPDGSSKWSRWGEDEFDAANTWSAPAIGPDGTVYVWKEDSLDEPSWPGGALYALDPDDGSTVWRYDVGDTTYGSPTIGPDGAIYIGSADDEDDSRLYALEPDGSLRWDWRPDSPECGFESSPALGAGGRVYVWHNCDGLVALDASGDELWTTDVGDAWNTPSVGPDGTIYIGNSDYYFYALNPDGSIRWRVPVREWMYTSSSAISADGSTILRGDNGGFFYGFDASGSVRWEYDTGTREQISAAPAVAANGVVFVAAGDSIHALRLADGRLLWRRSIGESGQPPAIGADGTLYVVGTDGDESTLYAFGCGADGDGDGRGDRCADVSPYSGTDRLAGLDRYATGVAISRAGFPAAASADAVVLARGDDPTGFADALSGTPLALAVRGPVLITRPDLLVAEVRAELERVLPRGRTVYLLGGERALSPAIEAEITALGYATRRLWGQTRYDTALRVAEALGAPDPILITTGDDFPDALAAGAAAAHTGGAVVLTPSERRWPALDAYLRDRGGATVYAIGGPAARPYPEATAVAGTDRFDTAVRVAGRFFGSPGVVGIARSHRFPDSLAGGAHIGSLGGPLLLTPTDVLNAPFTARYLCDHASSIGRAIVYGGSAAVSDGVRIEVADRIRGAGCA